MRDAYLVLALCLILLPRAAQGTRRCFDFTFAPPPTPLPDATVLELQQLAWARSRAEGGDVNLDALLHPVPAALGGQFEAHGIATGPMTSHLPSLLALLDRGINQARAFHSAPLVVPEGVGAGFGTVGGASTSGSFVLLSHRNHPLVVDGVLFVGHVIVNDAYYDAIPTLQANYPSIQFHRADQAPTRLQSAQ